MPNDANPYGLGQVKKSFLHFIFGKGATAFIGVGLLLLTVRALPAETYGAYVALLAAFEIIQLASNLGLFTAAYRYVPQLRASNRGRDLRKLVSWLYTLRILTLLTTVAAINLFAKDSLEILNILKIDEIILIYSIAIVAEGLSRYLDILFDSLLQQKYSQLSLIFRNGLRLIGLTGLIYVTNWNISLTNWVWIEVAASVMGAIFASVLLARHIVSLPKGVSSSTQEDAHTLRYFTFLGPSYLSQIVGLVYGPETTKLILTKVSGAIQVGAFGFAASLSGMLQRYLPVFLLLGLVRPLFVSVNTSDNRANRLNELANLVLKLNIFVLFPAIAYVLVSGDKLAHLLSGGKFSNSSIYIAAFMILLVFQTWHAVLGLVALAVEDGLSGLHGTLLGLLGLVIGLVLLPDYGPMSLCAGLIVSEIIWCTYVAHSLDKKKGVPIKNHWRGIANMFIFSATGFFVAFLANNIAPISQYSLFVDVIIIAAIFLGMCYRFKPFNDVERNIINKILPRPIFVW